MSESERVKYITYIHDNLNEMKFSHRKEILQIILYSNIDEDKIIEKGSGTEIRYSNIDTILLKNIYNFIYNKVEKGEDFI